jgi:hypothetical protein
LATLPSENAVLGGLPRRRSEAPPLLASRHAIEAIRDLRRLHPAIDFRPGTEATFLERAELTRAGCLQWLHIAKQFYVRSPLRRSAPVPSRSPPPISFLNLLIDWINAYARMTRRRRTKGPGWRWRALCGFVNRHRPLQSAELLGNISLLAKSIAAHFSKPPFDHPLLVLWEEWRRFQSRGDDSSSSGPSEIERGHEADKVFNVLKRVANNDKVVASDYSTLKPYLSKQFSKPFFIETLHNGDERKSLEEFIARAAAMDVYLQHRRVWDRIASDQDYVEEVTMWLLKLGEPEARLQFEAVHWRFCGHVAVDFERRPKKNVLRSGARKLR